MERTNDYHANVYLNGNKKFDNRSRGNSFVTDSPASSECWCKRRSLRDTNIQAVGVFSQKCVIQKMLTF